MTLAGAPILFVNNGFEAITGYSNAEVVGKNCRFLQNDKTDAPTTARLQEAMRNATEVHVHVVNSRKDGSQFLSLLALKPIFDANGLYRFMIGVLTVVRCPLLLHQILTNLKSFPLALPKRILLYYALLFAGRQFICSDEAQAHAVRPAPEAHAEPSPRGVTFDCGTICQYDMLV